MSSTSPNKSTEVHVGSVQPLDEVSFGDCLHPNLHEMLSLPTLPDPETFFEDPDIMSCIHFDDAHPHGEYYRRTHIVEMIELPFSPDSKESNCPLHKHVHPRSEPSQEDPEKATSPSSSELKSEEKLETANGDGGENGDANNLSPSKDPDDVAGMRYTYTVEYQWSPMLKYCTMEELGYKPIQLV